MEAKIFLTDYASYNNGTQFEFGHWIDLTQFADVNEFNHYVTEHFKHADETNPLDSPREEMMITGYEGFPSSLYSESGMNFEQLFEYINLEDNELCAVTFLLEQGQDFEYAMERCEDVQMYEDEGRKTHYELFEMWYPAAAAAEQKCDYLEIDYDRFIKEYYTEFEYNGVRYLVEDNSWS